MVAPIVGCTDRCQAAVPTSIYRRRPHGWPRCAALPLLLPPRAPVPFEFGVDVLLVPVVGDWATLFS